LVTAKSSLAKARTLVPMGNLTVAVIGATDYARTLGKKSTASDITFFDHKKGDVTLTLVEPTKYPDKLASLFFAVSMADAAVLVVEQINPMFGETVVMLDCVGVKKGYIVLRNFLSREQLAPFIKGTILESYLFVQDDPVSIRESLMADAKRVESTEPPKQEESVGSVPIDHFFDVRGIGTVVLGWVADGFLRRHDRVRILPGATEVEIRSIQKHDDDFEWAVEGDRVGIALKGVQIAELDRGMTLTNDPTMKAYSSVLAEARLVKYWLNPLKPGMVLHIGHWMQFVPARVEDVSNGDDWRRPTLKLTLQKDLAFRPNSRCVLAHLEGGKLRVLGTLELPA
jgi:selenocysteine-specific translation elongation factor